MAAEKHLNQKNNVPFPEHDCTVKPAHNGQIRSQTTSTVRSRWPLKVTATYEIIFMDRIKNKSTR